MRPVTSGLVPALLVFAACREATGPRVAPATITWLEWPAAVTVGQTAGLKPSGSAPCPYKVVFGLTFDGHVLRVTAEGRAYQDRPCPDGGSSAGYDTLLAIPALPPAPLGDNEIPIWAAVADPSGYYESAVRHVGLIAVSGVADTTVRFAGAIYLSSDSAGCWHAMPYSASPQPSWVFAKPIPLVPEALGRQAYLAGRLVAVSPPVCGASQAIDVFELEVNATP